MRAIRDGAKWLITISVACASLAAPVAANQALAANGVFEAEGFLQAEEQVAISSEIGGRIVELKADVGDVVKAGDVVVRLDDELILAQMDQAQAAVLTAQANLAYSKAGARTQEIAAANAAVDAATAQVAASEAAAAAAAARVTAANAKTSVAAAQYGKLAAGATVQELALADRAVELAHLQLWAAQANRDAARNGMNLPLNIPLVIEGNDFGMVSIPNPVGPTQADVEAAEARIVEAEGAIREAELKAERLRSGASAEELAVAQTAVSQASADAQVAQLLQQQAVQATAIARAQLGQVEAQRALLLAGPRSEDVAIAEARILEAQAQLAILQASAAKLTLTAPLGGAVTERLAHQGEVVTTGARLLVISAMDPMALTVYIDEQSLSRVRLGQDVNITSRAQTGSLFRGQVVHIASEAEFTPRISQGPDSGSSTVFAVRIRVPNSDGKLRPGMPAAATFK